MKIPLGIQALATLLGCRVEDVPKKLEEISEVEEEADAITDDTGYSVEKFNAFPLEKGKEGEMGAVQGSKLQKDIVAKAPSKVSIKRANWDTTSANKDFKTIYDEYIFPKGETPKRVSNAPGTTITSEGTQYSDLFQGIINNNLREGQNSFSLEDAKTLVSMVPTAEHGDTARVEDFKGQKQKLSDGTEGLGTGLFQMEGDTLSMTLRRLAGRKELLTELINNGGFTNPSIINSFNYILQHPQEFRHDGPTTDAATKHQESLETIQNKDPRLSTALWLMRTNLDRDAKGLSFELSDFGDLEAFTGDLIKIQSPGDPAAYIGNLYSAQYNLVEALKKANDKTETP